jgi:transposase
MAREMLDQSDYLWTFVDNEGLEPTNNAAERAIRPAVLWRKGSFGTDTAEGSRFAERILTAVTTLKQQGRSAVPNGGPGQSWVPPWRSNAFNMGFSTFV